MSFRPSGYSGVNIALPNEGEVDSTNAYDAQVAKSSQYAAMAQAGGMFASQIVAAVGASRQLKSQQAHEVAFAEKQAELYGLQAQAATAQGIAQRAAAAMEGMVTTRALIITGGVVLTFGLLVAGVIAVRRGREET